MMKHIKKTLSWMLVLCMVFSLMAPTSVFAAEVTSDAEVSVTEKVSEEDETIPNASDAEVIPETTGEENSSVSAEDVSGEENIPEASDTESVAEVSGEENVSTPSESEDGSGKNDAEEAPVGTGFFVETENVSDPGTVNIDDENDDIEMVNIIKEQSVPLNTNEFYRIFHLDCGRKYFSVEQIKTLIDVLAAYDYTAIELAIGNDGLRFLLDDMTVVANGTAYSSEEVTAGIQAGNKAYYDAGTNELTEDQMDDLIGYAGEKGIAVIPLINTPGHMDAILDAMEAVGIDKPAYGKSARTVDVTNAKAVNFTLALVEKYIQYFADKGCTIFNMGCDEYANDVTNGFSDLQDKNNYNYDAFAAYVNNMAAQIQNAGMTPLAFNDGIYYNNDTSSDFDSNIAIAYWTGGYSGNNVASADLLAGKGHAIINTSEKWYYVVGHHGDGWAYYNTALKGAGNTSVTSVTGSAVSPSGAMQCVWCDDPGNTYSEDEVFTLIETLATSNRNYFNARTVRAANGISVTAFGLIKVDAEMATAPVVSGATKLVAYDVKPYTVNKAYTDKGMVTIPVPEGWNGRVFAYVVNDDNSITKLPASVKDGVAVFDAPHFSVMGLGESDNVEVTDYKTITVPVGGTASDVINGTEYVGEYDTEDTSIATVTTEVVEGKDYTATATASIPKYATYEVGNVLDNNVDTFYWSGEAQGVGSYVRIDLGTAVIMNAVQISSPGDGDICTNADVQISEDGKEWTTVGTHSGSNTEKKTDTYMFASQPVRYIQVVITEKSDKWWKLSEIAFGTYMDGKFSRMDTSGKTDASTLVTFSGVATGTTTAIIGTTEYTVNVVAEDLSLVKPLEITRYISTSRVYNVSDHSAGNVVEVSAEQAFGESGISITEVVPEKGWWQYASDEIETVLWKGVVLDNLNQGSTSNTDYSMNGDDYSYIRYYNGKWSYSADRVTWSEVKETDYVNAYYLQKTQVTDEVETYVKDWAFTTSNSESQEGDFHQKALSFAVVYPNGQLSPESEKDIYADSTLIYWENLANLGFIRIGTNEVYEVEKLTYTLGERSNSTSTANWGTSDLINWEKVKVDGTNDQWYKETVCWTEDSGTEPVINGADLTDKIYAGQQQQKYYYGKYYDGTWGFNDAVLILIYLKPVKSEDSLTVRYWDDSTGSQIYEYPVNISNTSTEEKGTFLNRLEQKSTVEIGDITLDDDAYVVNAKNVQEGFEKDLTKIAALRGKYSSGLYNYIKAEISEDGKTLTLHYNLDSDKLQPYYIADFGLNVEIPFEDLGGDVLSAKATVPSTANGEVSVDNAEKKIIFKANKTYSGVTVLTVTATFSDGSTQLYNVGIYPATTVYYEETFATGDFKSVGTALNTKQQALAYGNKSDHSNAFNFGYDEEYADDGVGASNGTEVVSEGKGEKETFVFTGTGVDIYANTNVSTGRLFVQVKDSNNKTVKTVQVDTAMVNGGFAQTIGQNTTGYSVPVISLDLDKRDTYTVNITHVIKSANEEIKPVRLDGFKVFGTIDINSSVYEEDNEKNPNYVEVRNAVLKVLDVSSDSEQTYNEADNAGGAIIINGNGSIDSNAAQDLLENGPKNEIYLFPGQSLAFNLNSGITSSQIGLKALNDTVVYSINGGESKSLNTSVDMFYKLDKSNGFTITNTKNSGGILAVTDLKYFGTPTSAANVMAAPSRSTVKMALTSLGIEEDEVDESVDSEPVYADAVLTIAVNDAEGNALVSTTLTANGIKDENAIFTDADIKTAVEALELPEDYRLEDTSYSDVAVVYGESCSVIFKAVKEEVVESAPTPEPEPTPDVTPATPESGLSKIWNSVMGFFQKVFGR